MTLDAWKYVDRVALVSHTRLRLEADARATLTVLRGNAQSGRDVACDLVAELHQAHGFEVRRIREPAGATATVRDLLAAAWVLADPPGSSNEVPRSMSLGHRMQEQGLIAELQRCTSAGSTAFVFDTVDPLTPIPPPKARFFVELALKTRSPVVVACKSNDGAEFGAGASVFHLERMDINEVRSSLFGSGHFTSLSASAANEVMSLLESEASRTRRIPAELVYEYVQSAMAVQ